MRRRPRPSNLARPLPKHAWSIISSMRLRRSSPDQSINGITSDQAQGLQRHMESAAKAHGLRNDVAIDHPQ
jgi:hypothetical protein